RRPLIVPNWRRLACDRWRVSGSRRRPLLIRGGGAGRELDLGTRRGRRRRVVQALAEGAQRAVAADGPGLGGGAVAVVELHRRAVRRPGPLDVQALAEGAQRAVAVDGPG